MNQNHAAAGTALASYQTFEQRKNHSSGIAYAEHIAEKLKGLFKELQNPNTDTQKDFVNVIISGMNQINSARLNIGESNKKPTSRTYIPAYLFNKEFNENDDFKRSFHGGRDDRSKNLAQLNESVKSNQAVIDFIALANQHIHEIDPHVDLLKVTFDHDQEENIRPVLTFGHNPEPEIEATTDAGMDKS